MLTRQGDRPRDRIAARLEDRRRLLPVPPPHQGDIGRRREARRRSQLPHGDAAPRRILRRVETYREHLTGTVPVIAGERATSVTLEVKYQGCADAGVCYPPQTRTLTVALPALRSGSAASRHTRQARGRAAPQGDAACRPRQSLGKARDAALPLDGAERRPAVAAGTGLRVRGHRRRRQHPAAALHPGARLLPVSRQDHARSSTRRRHRAAAHRAGRRARRIATNTSAMSWCISTRSKCRCRCAAPTAMRRRSR